MGEVSAYLINPDQPQLTFAVIHDSIRIAPAELQETAVVNEVFSCQIGAYI